MGYKYNPHRSRNLYDPKSKMPFKISRSKIDRFVECPRCFYIDRRLGTDRPPGFPFNINSAVDTLLKTEFDTHRAAGTPHPLQQAYDIDAIPAAHAEIDTWRENFKGVQHHHEATNLIITGAIDDLWIDSAGRYLVVDYKATAKKAPVTTMEAAWMVGYKRQMEIYQWLLRRNGLDVSDTGYFVYCTGNPNAPAFDARMHEVYWAAYELGADGLVQLVGLESVSPPERVELPPGNGWEGVGSGWLSYEEVLRQRLGGAVEAVHTRQLCHARDIAHLAVQGLAVGAAVSAELALPVYLRNQVARKPRSG